MIFHQFGDFKRQFLLGDELTILLMVLRQNLVISLMKLSTSQQLVAPTFNFPIAFPLIWKGK